jgi:hypothetical protein
MTLGSEHSSRFWVKISLLSFVIVAILGTLMRYKIAFDFPYFNQKNLQHGHSHFAFAGWITQLLMVYIIYTLKETLSNTRLVKYNIILIANYITSLGMLIFFSMVGYKIISITFSTLSIVVFILFTIFYFSDTSKIKTLSSHLYIKSGLLLGIISFLGTFVLAFNMITKNYDQSWYLSSIYWYLHFQYNGWFLFSCLGLLHQYLEKNQISFRHQKLVFFLFLTTSMPSFGLSVLWLKLPFFIYFITILSAIGLMIGWWILVKQLFSKIKALASLIALEKYMLIFIATAFTIKVLLQLVSVHPELSTLAFGYRNIVIAYLHLSLLAITTVFLIFYGLVSRLIINNLIVRNVIIGIMGLIFLTELILGLQGIMSFSYRSLPYNAEILFILSFILVILSFLLFYLQNKIIRRL